MTLCAVFAAAAGVISFLMIQNPAKQIKPKA
jgi:hypothetical protein